VRAKPSQVPSWDLGFWGLGFSPYACRKQLCTALINASAVTGFVSTHAKSSRLRLAVSLPVTTTIGMLRAVW